MADSASSPPTSEPQVPKRTGPALVDVYQQMFEGLVATSPELLEKVYRLRYQVYCVEHQFEDPAENPDGLERDAYDDHSVHALLVHRASQLPIGTVRFILRNPDAPPGMLPFHKLCRHPAIHDPDFLPPTTTAEFSRFAISKTFRRRTNDGAYGRAYEPKELAGDTRRIIPHITIGLMTVALQLGIAYRLTHVCAVMDPALLRLLSRFGIQFEPLGPQVEYHGLRQPCYAHVPTLLAGIEAARHDIWEVITDRGRLWKSAFDRMGRWPSLHPRESSAMAHVADAAR